MNALDLLFGPVPNALCAMFEYGFLPREEDFLELTPEQYHKYVETLGDVKGKIYMLVSQQDPSRFIGESNEICCLTESDKKGFIDAIAIIEKYCEGQNFTTDEQKQRISPSLLAEALNIPYSVVCKMNKLKLLDCARHCYFTGTAEELRKHNRFIIDYFYYQHQ